MASTVKFVATGDEGAVKLDDVSAPGVTSSKNSAIITWSDPSDVVIEDLTVAKWDGTRVVRKVGSAPTAVSDGTLVVDSRVRNQYASTGYVDSGLEYDTTYYYRFFPYTDMNVITDGSSVNVTPQRTVITVVPSQSGSLTYNRSQQTAQFTNYNPDELSVTGNTGTSAGSYTAEFTPKEGYCWSDGSLTSKSVTWIINKAQLTKPTQSGTVPTYTGSTITATWDTYDSMTMNVAGNTGVDAGTYTATFSIKTTSNYEWTDGTIASKTSDWVIDKATGSVSVDKSSVTLNTSTLYTDVTITQVGDGALSVSSSNSSVATVGTITNNVFRITGVNSGSCTVTVSSAASTNYTAASTTISVTASFVDTVLNNNSWSTISSISTAGTASNYWSVGDTKQITIDGTVGTKTYAYARVWVYILGFDHNAELEGDGISFGCFKTAQTNGTDICLDDGHYNSDNTSGAKWFNMNHQRSSASQYGHNYGGWKGCDLRYDVLGSTDVQPSEYNTGSTYITTSRVGYDASTTCATNPVSGTLMAALPSDLRAVMKPITKYTDNTGNSSNIAANVTASIDYLPLLAEYEVQGSRSYANQYEQDSQTQYIYYANGNSKIKYRQSAVSSAAWWWVRSVNCYYAYSFCRVYTSGSATHYDSRCSYGLAPVFLI